MPFCNLEEDRANCAVKNVTLFLDLKEAGKGEWDG